MTYEELLKKDNFKCTAILGDTYVNDAKISVNFETGNVFICQNEKDGNFTFDKKGYKYSWQIMSNSVKSMEAYNVKNFVILDNLIHIGYL